MPTSSTAEAARYVAEHPQFKNEIACIASSLAAKEYHLKVMAPSIEDAANNTTRFIVISRTEAKPTGKDRTSLVFAVKDRVGSLHDILSHFQKANINLTKIESRPSKKKIWSYFFFVDFEGHAKDTKIEPSLLTLEKHCTLFKVLGSYPKADF